jgi:hypothetical protein
VDQGPESGEHGYSRDESPSGEAWEHQDESGQAAWDDGSGEIWGDAEQQTGDARRRDEEDLSHTALPPKVEAWRKRSATGAILTGFAFGLQQVFEPKDEPAVVMETSGDPPRDLPVEADLEYGRPRHSVVNIRPWLLPGDQQLDDQQLDDQQPGDQQAGEQSPADPQAGTGKHEEDRDDHGNGKES